MSGFEIIGIVLGAFPLAISAIEHYHETAKAAGTFWRIRKAYEKDHRSINFCQTKLKLHMEALLGPLVLVNITNDLEKCLSLVQDPQSEDWIDNSDGDCLQKRLRHCYETYMEVMQDLEILMEKLDREFKAHDENFQQLLVDDRHKQPRSGFKKRLHDLAKGTAFQGQRLAYSVNFAQRESLLLEVERYIDRLTGLLEDIDRVSASSRQKQFTHQAKAFKPLIHFWQHAQRMWDLLISSMKCSCGPHCARLWLHSSTEKDVTLKLCLLFASTPQPHSPWDTRTLLVKHLEDFQVPASSNTPSSSPSSIAGPGSTQSGTRRYPSLRFANAQSPMDPVADLMLEGLCKTLSSSASLPPCLGALHHSGDDMHYRVFPASMENMTTRPSLSVSKALQAGCYRTYRFAVAVKLVSAQLRYHSSPWLPKQWTLDSILLPQSRDSLFVEYDKPYFLARLTPAGIAHTPSAKEDQSFWTLGIVLLELCFGRRLESHPLWSDTNIPRNSLDSCHRQIVAQKWAKDIELEASEDFAKAVKWCLQEAPTTVTTDPWRQDYVQNVLQPLTRCYESMTRSAT